MRTVQILRQLLQQISNNPNIIPLLPWDDVTLCVLTELENRECLYPAYQLQAVEQNFSNLLTTIQQSCTSADAKIITKALETIIFALETFPDADYVNALYENANYDRACLNHYKNNTTIVLGDSHVNFFSGNEQLSFLPIGNDVNTCPLKTSYSFTPLHIGPCLAYHCNMPDTSCHFQEKVEYLLQNFIKPNAKIVVCLGEIDIRVHVFPQAQKQNKPYQSIIDSILKEYLSFLCDLKENGYQVSCWGPIASQKDTCPVDPAFPRNGSEKERNMATAYFNQKLSQLCNQNGIHYYSIFPQMITANYETIEDYLSPDRCHLGQSALLLAKPLLEEILSI